MKKFSLLFYIISFIFIGLSVEISAQSSDINLQDISNINVDELSDDQIKKLVEQVESSGYSEDQLIMLAQSRGMDQIQIQKLKSRMQSVGSSSPQPGSDTDLDRMRFSPVDLDPIVEEKRFAFDPFENILEMSAEIPEGLQVFGQDFFQNSNLNFETDLNIPTPTNYVLGAGDEIIIDIWGISEQSYQLVISPEGAIRVPILGPIYLSGLTIEKAKSKIISRLKKIFSSIGRGSSADVSLGQIRSINIHVIGAVMKPGTYTLSSFGTAFNALYSAGGPTDKGTLRQIEIFRNKKLISTLDAYALLIKGTGENITLQDQDVIIVRGYQSRIALDGEVKNPAYFELLDGETMEDLLLYTGGFTENAYDGVLSLRRIEGNFKVVKSVKKDSLASLELKNGDEIFVNKISGEFKNRVTIEGPVLNAGEYELTEGLKLSELLKLADGYRGDIFIERAIIVRQKDDFSLSSIAFDPQQLMDGSFDLDLKNNDVVKFQSIYDLREKYKITVQGEVLRPGEHVYVDGLTVEDLIYLAGGFKESASKSFVEVARRINPDSTKDAISSATIFNFNISKDLKLNNQDSKFKLEPYDMVSIRKSPFYSEQEVITIEGEVQYPGKYSLEKKNERISSVLQRAGGISELAYPQGATLIRRSEYYKGNSEDVLKEASKIRKEDLTSIFKKDTLFSNENEIFRQQEFIGLDIEAAMKNPGSKYDLTLRAGDIISMPRQFQTVRIRGEVLYPSNIRYDASNGFKKYISQSGGFDQMAKKTKAYVIYPNGSSAQTKNFLFFRNYPKIEPGSEIVIPKKPDPQPMSAQAWIAISTSVATLALIIQQLVK
ncbi:MAG: SLBB domain-containing protein [Reichenbachiella sp.]